MALIIPPIIGWPGAIAGDVVGQPGSSMHEHIIRTLNLAYMQPRTIQNSGGTEIWKSVSAMSGDKEGGSSEFDKYLLDGSGITGREVFSGNPGGLTVAFQHMSPVSESYSNEFSQNSILAGMQSGNQLLQDAGMLYGGASGGGGWDALKKKAPGVMKTAEDFLQQGEDIAGKIGGSGGQKFANTMTTMLKKFDHKIDFPMMWRGSSFSTSYNLMIRLYNPIPASDDYYQRLIVAPLVALLSFVCPRSNDGKTWTYPFIMKFDIPGRAHLTSAFCSSLSVVKGGDVNDIAYSSRPNIVDINMTINPVHSVKLNSKRNVVGDAPTLRKEIDQTLMTQIEKPLMPGTDFPAGKPGSGTPAQNGPVNTGPSINPPAPSRSQTAQQAAAVNGLTSALVANALTLPS